MSSTYSGGIRSKCPISKHCRQTVALACAGPFAAKRPVHMRIHPVALWLTHQSMPLTYASMTGLYIS